MKKKYTNTLLMLLMGLLLMPLLANGKGYLPQDEAFDKILGDFGANLEDEDKLDNMLENAQKLYTTKKTPERRAYIGSMIAKKATYTIFPWKKLSYANDGSKMLDKAVQKAPNNFDVRSVRLNTYLNMPDMLGKQVLSTEDYKFLRSYYDKRKDSDDFKSKRSKESTMSLLAKFNLRYGDGKDFDKLYSKITMPSYKKSLEEFKLDYAP